MPNKAGAKCAGYSGPEGSGFEKAEDLEGKIIATELVEVSKRYFASKA